MRVAVVGGSGVVGRHVVAALGRQGAESVVLARGSGVDLTTGAGLAGRLDGVTAVIDVTGVVTTSAKRSRSFFGAVTRSLLAEEQRAGVRHHVALSIVGSDRVDYGYYLGKREQERLVLGQDARGTVLRTTQFHEFASQLLGLGRAGVVPVPRMLCQPVAAAEVADALVALAPADPAGLAPELAGPAQEWLPDLVRRLLRSRGERRLVVPFSLPGQVGRDMAGGGVLPTGPGPRGTLTFAQWLAEGPPQPGALSP